MGGSAASTVPFSDADAVVVGLVQVVYRASEMDLADHSRGGVGSKRRTLYLGLPKSEIEGLCTIDWWSPYPFLNEAVTLITDRIGLLGSPTRFLCARLTFTSLCSLLLDTASILVSFETVSGQTSLCQ